MVTLPAASNPAPGVHATQHSAWSSKSSCCSRRHTVSARSAPLSSAVLPIGPVPDRAVANVLITRRHAVLPSVGRPAAQRLVLASVAGASSPTTRSARAPGAPPPAAPSPLRSAQLSASGNGSSNGALNDGSRPQAVAVQAPPSPAVARQLVEQKEKKEKKEAPARPVLLPIEPIPAIPQDVINEFEHKLEADLQTVAVTITAIMGVIIFWRGVWALLDHYIGDSVFGDICCVIAGLSIVLYIRLSGMKIASFWPPS